MKPVRRREQGIILFVAVLLLAIMGALAIASLDTASRDRQAAGYYNRSNAALFAADAGVAEAISLIKADPYNCPSVIPFATQGAPVLLGDTTAYAEYTGQPAYYGDPAAVNAVECIRIRAKAGSGMSRAGSLKPKVAEWRIFVVGESPDGSRARIEVLHEEELLASGT